MRDRGKAELVVDLSGHESRVTAGPLALEPRLPGSEEGAGAGSGPERTSRATEGRASPSTDFQAIFDATPTPFLVISPANRTIVAAHDARLCVTGAKREAQIGRLLFDVFPDDPDDPEASGVRNLKASLNGVVG